MTIREGDEVRVSLRPARVLQAALLAYGLPLAGTSLALAVATVVVRPLSDAVAVVAALLGGGAGLVIGRLFLRRDACLRNLQPEIAARLRPQEHESVHNGA